MRPNSLITRFRESSARVVQDGVVETPVVVSIGELQDQRLDHRHQRHDRQRLKSPKWRNERGVEGKTVPTV